MMRSPKTRILDVEVKTDFGKGMPGIRFGHVLYRER